MNRNQQICSCKSVIGFLFKRSFVDFVLKSNLRIFFRNCFTDFFSKEFSRIFAQRFFRGFSLEYSFADFLLNILSRIFIQIWLCGTIKKSYEGVLFTKLFIQGFTKSNKSFNTLFNFPSKEIFAQIFLDFFSNILSRVFF